MQKKICVRCKRKIFGNEDYIQIFEYWGGKKEKETFYHRNCFDDTMKPKKMAAVLVGRTMNLLNKAEERIA